MDIFELIAKLVSFFTGAETANIEARMREIPQNSRLTVAFAAALLQVKGLGKECPRQVRRLVDRVLRRFRHLCVGATLEQAEQIGQEMFRLMRLEQEREAEAHQDLTNVIFGVRESDVTFSVRSLKLFTRLFFSLVSRGSAKENLKEEAPLFFLLSLWLRSFGITRTIDNVLVETKRCEEARRTLDGFLMALGCAGQLKVKGVVEDAEGLAAHVRTSPMDYIKAGVVTIPIWQPLERMLRDYIDDYAARIARGQEPLTELIEWFAANSEMMATQWEAMWTDIAENVRVGIRPNGRDMVKLRMAPFNTEFSKHLFVQFRCEEEVWPAVGVNYWTEIGDERLIVHFRLDPEAVDIRKVCAEDCRPEQVVDAIMRFVSLDCYWRIVCRQPGSKERHGGTGTGKKKRKWHFVRPHWRWLMPGRNASGSAIARAANLWHQLPPPGRTFVQPHARCAVEADGRPEDVEPLFAYSENDLMGGR